MSEEEHIKMMDYFAVRELVENWVMWRDRGDWERFRTIWHPEGTMIATWFQGGWEQFMEGSKIGFDQGVRVLHVLGGSTIDVVEDRATAETKITIHQRAVVEGVLCDVACMGRSYDLFERRAGKWGLVVRQHVYDKDRIDPVDPTARLVLDRSVLEGFPDGYRHLAYVQQSLGLEIRCDLPCAGSIEAEAVLQSGARWLSGMSATDSVESLATASGAIVGTVNPGEALTRAALSEPRERPGESHGDSANAK
jgi:hypothetical protein